MPRLLLFAATTGYQIHSFDSAARRAGASLTLATDRCHVLDDPWGDRAIPVKFDRPAESLAALRGLSFDGICAVGDHPAVLAAYAAQALGLPFHPPAAALAAHDKLRARALYRAAGLPVPDFFEASAEDASRAPYPCVLKPIGGAASRGVIRADDPDEFHAAFARIRRMGEDRIQCERYIPGPEFAVEAIMTAGRLHPLAIFDKPDPMEGPYFEETIYTTPSRASGSVQRDLLDAVARASAALGLRHGPVHAELRYNSAGAWILETHARPIGGLCSRALRFVGDLSLEDLIVRHALGQDVASIPRDPLASGVMMIPIPRPGIYESVEGAEAAAAVPGIDDVVITAKPGQHLLQLPEGSTYLGFLFSRASTPADVEQSLRQSHAALRFHIATALETLRS